METKHNYHTLIITDASGIISLIVDTDTNHAPALQFAEEQKRAGSVFVLPAELFAETINLLGKKFSRGLALETAEFLIAEPAVIVSDTDEETRKRALDMFAAAPSGVSYTDCVVMAMAETRKTPYIFGFDEIFTVRGYEVPGADAQAA